MKIYKIKVNGKTYKVELESIEDNGAAAPAPAPAAVKKEAEQPKASAPVLTGPAGGQDVVSPIQGTVVKVLVKPGDKVTKGTILLIVEAMKLENEVPSPFDGEVAEVLVVKGQSVASKERIVVIR